MIVLRFCLLGCLRALCALLLLVLGLPCADAQLQIDIHQGIFRPVSLGMPSFSSRSRKRAQNVRAIVEADLNRSGLIRVLKGDRVLEKTLALEDVPDFASWRLSGANAVLALELRKEKKRIEAELQIWDVPLQRPLTREVVSALDSRRLAHKISDAIYTRLTGESGYFSSRILYVSERIRKGRRTKRLAIMDYDGANHRFLTEEKASLALTPRASPDGRQGVYTALLRTKSEIRLVSLVGKAQAPRLVPLRGDNHGLVYAARFSSNGKRLVFAQSINGNSEIFLYDLVRRNRRRLTFHPAIDTSPSFSPDDNYIAFISDRSGSTQIYVMTDRGSDVQRVDFADGVFGTPLWSPRGDWIAFTRQLEGRFGIGVMRPDGSDMRILTEGFRVEGPSWSPNGRVLVFFKKERTRKDGSGGEARLFTIDITGRFLREVPTPFGGSDPSWTRQPQD